MVKTTEASQANTGASSAPAADTATDAADTSANQAANQTPDTDGPPTDGDDQDKPGKGNKEAAKYRRQLREVEAARDTLAAQHDALRKQVVEDHSGLERPEALWAAGVELGALFDVDGRLDGDKLAEAVTTASDRLGLRAVAATPRFDPSQGGKGGHQPAAPSLADAFTPR